MKTLSKILILNHILILRGSNGELYSLIKMDSVTNRSPLRYNNRFSNRLTFIPVGSWIRNCNSAYSIDLKHYGEDIIE